MARGSQMTYDPTTGIWKPSSGGSKNSSSQKKKETPKKNNTPTTTTPTTKKDTPKTTDKKSASGKTEKKYKTIEYNILEGSLEYIPTKDTIKLKAGNTVKLKGLGKYLSGNYYVQDITRKIGSNGYSHSATLVKTNYGESLKSSGSNKTSKTKKTPTTKKGATPTKKEMTTQRQVHYVQKGESLWTIAQKFYKDGSKYTKILKANNLKESQCTNLPIGTKLIIP